MRRSAYITWEMQIKQRLQSKQALMLFTWTFKDFQSSASTFEPCPQSRMKETSERLIHLEHVPSSVFHNLLEFYFNGNFKVPQEELGPNIQVSCYLLAEAFLSKCLSVLAEELGSSNCSSYLSLAQETCCSELRLTVLTFLSRNLLEVPHVFRKLNHEDKRDVIKLRTRGEPHLCNLRKENLTSWSDPETERSRYIFGLTGPENCKDWQRVTELPFRADKWCFTTVVLLNYLFLLGGHRQQVKRGWEFTKVSFRFNPISRSWTSISPMIKVGRSFCTIHLALILVQKLFRILFSTGDISARLLVKAVFMQWEAGTWTLW
ncbi:Kelch repeat and BTB domain-containing protein 11 [Oryzias melastigma]|uniref:Kelch repeat and BTB domain-containing protein 11 n=1 Tax=Oryzias melastigma TaxID=30732 RepID=A0A834FJ38_ORYME|nr:Kelch repeat and BTB domain-containing protein 11 [Oryzias melastigma]